MAGQIGMLAAKQLDNENQARALRRVATARGWDRTHRGVFGLPWADDPRRDLARVLLWVGPPAALTARTALWHVGLFRGRPARSDILVPHGRRNRRTADALLMRTRHFDHARVGLVGGMPTVSVEWALTDLARTAGVSALRAAAIDARQRGLLDFTTLSELVDLRGPIRGIRRLRSVRRQLDPVHCDSELEYLIRDRVDDDPRLPAPDPAPVDVRCSDGRVVHIDIAWPAAHVGLECLGFGSHSSRSQLDRDVMRDNALVDTPWRIYQATWTHVDNDEAWMKLAAQLRFALAVG